MTARQVYEAVLVEMNKVQAPSLLLEDFNYLFNKAINQYINKRYNIYDINQQTTDDLRVLKSSVTLRALNDKSPINDVTVRDSMYGAIYEFALPVDYLHLLNCVCNFKVNKPFKCYNANTYVQFPATRLTSDMWSQIINNFYMRPMYKRPYYFIHNVNSYPEDSQWSNSQNVPNTTVDLNTKVDYRGNFGRVPSENIYIPTDGGNTDISHLKVLTDPSNNNQNVKSRYGADYVDDNNHYLPQDRKYGIPRYLDFSNIEANSTAWVRTGRGKIVGTYNGKDITLGDISFKIKEDSNHDIVNYGLTEGVPNDIEPGTIKVMYNTSVVADITLSGTNATASVTGVIGQTLNGFKTQYVEGANNDQVVINGAKAVYEWVPKLTHQKFDSVEKVGEVRYGNPSTVRLEIRYGKDNSLFTLDSVYVDYIKSPQYIRITQEQLDLTEDTSQIMEFPDYVIQEIINELVHIVMENSADPRLQSHIPISQSIANPAQQQEAPQQRRG